MQKNSKVGAALASVLVPALAVAILWLGMGQMSLAAVEIQDEPIAASVQDQATVDVADDAGVVPELKTWEYTLRTTGPIPKLSGNLNTRVARTSAS